MKEDIKKLNEIFKDPEESPEKVKNESPENNKKSNDLVRKVMELETKLKNFMGYIIIYNQEI